MFPMSDRVRNLLMCFIFFSVGVVNGRRIEAHRSWLMAMMLAVVLKSGVKSGPFIRICLKTAHLHAKFMQQSIKASQSWLQPASDFNL